MNTSAWFPHNVNARHDDKIIALRADHGPAGYGIYFMLLERLAQTPGHTVPYQPQRLAYETGTTPDILESIVRDYALFQITDEQQPRFFSPGMMERDRLREQKKKAQEPATLSEKRRAAATTRWSKVSRKNANSGENNADIMQNHAKPMQNECKTYFASCKTDFASGLHNADTPSPDKEKRTKKEINPNPAPTHTRDAHANNANNENYENYENYVSYAPPDPETVQAYCDDIGIRLNAQRFCDYYTANGWLVGKNPMRDWHAAARNWARKDQEEQTLNKNSQNNGKPATLPTANNGTQSGSADCKPYQRVQTLANTAFRLE